MTAGHVCIAMRLDGFVTHIDQGLDWLMKQKTEGEVHGLNAFMDSVGGILMGRGSFENVLKFEEWPYTKPVIVMSKALTPEDIPETLEGKVRLTQLDPVELMHLLDGEGWSRAYVDGGRVVQSFVRLGLIRDFVLTTIPILIGDGVRLFGEIDRDIDLELLGSSSFKSGLLQTHYRIAASD